MDAEFFIHGPRHAFYGKQEDSQYCQLFDNSQIKDDIRFVVEVRKGGNGKWCTYYNYCRYANVLDIDGRSGAYIGLTVRLDAYYSNLRNMYTVLEATFSAKVVGLLVKKTQTGYQYIVADFKNSQQTILSYVEKSLGAMLMGVIAEDEVYAIDSSFSSGGKEIIKGLDDNQYSSARMEDIKKTGKLVFASSKDIDLVDELNRGFSRREQILREEQEKVISQMRSSLDEAGIRESELRSDLLRSNEQVASLTEQNQSLESISQEKEKENAELSTKLEGLTVIEDKLDQFQREIDNLRREKASLERSLKNQDSKPNSHGINPSNSGHQSSRPASEPQSQKSLPDWYYGSGHGSNEHRRVDKVSTKWSFRELGEGLKIGIIAFFLVAIIAAALLFISGRRSGKIGKVHSSEVNVPLSAQKEPEEKAKCYQIPNALSDRTFPQCAGAETSDMLSIVPAEDNIGTFAFSLSVPSFYVEEFEWVIKDSAQNTCLQVKSNNLSVTFSPVKHDTYSVRVFVNDTLIVMKRFNY
ncbi:MAG: hypothetical protein IKX20_03420 [Paludibacteraceae bacterium]|nr:hypothetical protein [Paludibacteraceae bacterium]